MRLGCFSLLARGLAAAGLAGGLAAAPLAAPDAAAETVVVLDASEMPSNNNFAAAMPIALAAGARAVVAATNKDATREAGEPRHRSVLDTTTVWFRMQALASGTVTVDTHGAQIDTVIAVYTGSTLANLTRLRLDDNYDRTNRYTYRTSRVVFDAAAGTTYHVVVAGKRGAEGAYRIWFTGPGAPYY